MSQQQHTPEPFGHFKAEAFGWTDCAETDDGAQPLYDQAAIDELGERLMVSDYALMDAERQRDALLNALSSVMTMDVKGHQFQDRLQFSPAGREILEQCNAAIASAKGSECRFCKGSGISQISDPCICQYDAKGGSV